MFSYPKTSFDPFFVNDFIVCFFCSDPSSVELNIDGSTDKCSKGEDINFIFTGFTLSGKVSFVPFNSFFTQSGELCIILHPGTVAHIFFHRVTMQMAFSLYQERLLRS